VIAQDKMKCACIVRRTEGKRANYQRDRERECARDGAYEREG